VKRQSLTGTFFVGGGLSGDVSREKRVKNKGKGGGKPSSLWGKHSRSRKGKVGKMKVGNI